MKGRRKPHQLFLFSLVATVLAIVSTSIGYMVATGARDYDRPRSEKTEILLQVSNAEEQNLQTDATQTLGYYKTIGTKHKTLNYLMCAPRFKM